MKTVSNTCDQLAVVHSFTVLTVLTYERKLLETTGFSWNPTLHIIIQVLRARLKPAVIRRQRRASTGALQGLSCITNDKHRGNCQAVLANCGDTCEHMMVYRMTWQPAVCSFNFVL